MVRLILMLLLSLDVLSAEYSIKVLPEDIKDGDTFVLHDSLPYGLESLSVRVLGIDCAEIHSKNLVEKGRGLTAKGQLRELLTTTGSDVQLRNVKWDKFGGRIDAQVLLDGKDIKNTMINSGNCVEYYGEKKSHDWSK